MVRPKKAINLHDATNLRVRIRRNTNNELTMLAHMRHITKSELIRRVLQQYVDTKFGYR